MTARLIAAVFALGAALVFAAAVSALVKGRRYWLSRDVEGDALPGLLLILGVAGSLSAFLWNFVVTGGWPWSAA